MKGKLFGVDKKWVIIAGALAVVVFIYMRRSAANRSSTPVPDPSAGTDNGSIDPSQLASDIAGQLGASLGGSPATTDPNAVTPQDNSDILNALAQMQGQSADQFNQFLAQLLASGIVQKPTPDPGVTPGATPVVFSTEHTSPYVQSRVGPYVTPTAGGFYAPTQPSPYLDFATAGFLNSPNPAAPTPYTPGGSVNINQAFK